MKDLKVTIIQSPLHWENPGKNLEMFSRKISSIPEPTDLIVLPEMFTTGFTMKPHPVAEKPGGKTMLWMKQKSAEKRCVVTGSLATEENGRFFNRIIWQKPDGTHESYNKKHLFRYANEQASYTPGNKKLIVELPAGEREQDRWRISPNICYDLRFPVWCRNRIPDAPYDVLVFVANWPARRSRPWVTLLQARAIENQCFVVGVNRIGEDGNGFSYSGDSAVINPLGEIISHTKANEESVETVILSRKLLDEWRQTFPAWMDADNFMLPQ